MRAHRRGRISLLEVVFTLFIIALLAALLLPAIQTSRDGVGSRSHCQNNLRQLGLGLLQVQENRRQFPGYANVIGRKRASWVVTILPQLERTDLYQNWQREDLTPNYSGKDFGQHDARIISPLEILLCPSSDVAADREDALSFVVNSGSAWSANDFKPPLSEPHSWVEDLASGVFFNRARADFSGAIPQPNPLPPPEAFAPESGPIMTADYISTHDGTTYTMLLSENLQAGGWACNPLKPGEPMQSEFQMRQSAAFVWYVTGQTDNLLPVSEPIARLKAFDTSVIAINQRSDLKSPLPDNFTSVPSSNYGGLAAARPSGNHSGGVNVMYCGGNCGYLSEEIDYRVYTQLMTPNGREVVVDIAPNGEPIRANAPAGTSKRVATPWTYDLDETAF